MDEGDGLASEEGRGDDVTAIDRLRSKVRDGSSLVKLTTVVVPPHLRIVKGRPVRVEGYTYQRAGLGYERAIKAGNFRRDDFAGLPAGARDRAAHVEDVVGSALKEGLGTEHQHAVVTGTLPNGEPRFEWSPDRQKLHKQIVDHFYNERFAHVPSDGKAVIAGGLGGAGKSTILRQLPDLNPKEFGTVNPDDIKEYMAEHGHAPVVGDLTPMEASALIHEESSHIAKLLADRAYQENKNLIWDITMSSRKSVQARLEDLYDNGYGDIRGIFVDIPPDISVRRALGRWWQGVQEWREGKNTIGGRYVPPRLIRKAVSKTTSSANREVFDAMHDGFTRWEVWDTKEAARKTEQSRPRPRTFR